MAIKWFISEEAKRVHTKFIRSPREMIVLTHLIGYELSDEPFHLDRPMRSVWSILVGWLLSRAYGLIERPGQFF